MFCKCPIHFQSSQLSLTQMDWLKQTVISLASTIITNQLRPWGFKAPLLWVPTTSRLAHDWEYWGKTYPLPALMWQLYSGAHGDADPSPRGPCVVDATNKFTQTAEVLWRKRDGMATLWVREGPDPCLDRLLLPFWAHYIEDGPHLLCIGLL